MLNKDEVKGKAKQIKGAIKDKVGEVTNNPRLEAEGEAERLEGKVQEKVGKTRRKVGKAIKKAGKVLGGSLIPGLMALTIIGASAIMSGCETADRGMTNGSTPQAQMSNADLEDKIKAKLNSDAQLKAADLDVDANVDRNEITLTGVVESELLRTKAVELSKSAHEGLFINARIDVKPSEISRQEYTEELARQDRLKAKEQGETVGDSLDDAWIHTKIVAQLIGNSATPERKINVDVKNNMVTLRGTVETAAQKMEAERVAKNTEGVKSVRNLLKVVSAPVAKS